MHYKKSSKYEWTQCNRNVYTYDYTDSNNNNSMIICLMEVYLISDREQNNVLLLFVCAKRDCSILKESQSILF